MLSGVEPNHSANACTWRYRLVGTAGGPCLLLLLLLRRINVAAADLSAAFDGVAILTGGRRLPLDASTWLGGRLLRALVQRSFTSAGRVAAAQRVQRDGEDRARREFADRDALLRRRGGARHLDGPNDRLAVCAALDVRALLVHGREENLQVVRIGV